MKYIGLVVILALLAIPGSAGSLGNMLESAQRQRDARLRAYEAVTDRMSVEGVGIAIESLSKTVLDLYDEVFLLKMKQEKSAPSTDVEEIAVAVQSLADAVTDLSDKIDALKGELSDVRQLVADMPDGVELEYRLDELESDFRAARTEKPIVIKVVAPAKNARNVVPKKAVNTKRARISKAGRTR